MIKIFKSKNLKRFQVLMNKKLKCFQKKIIKKQEKIRKKKTNVNNLNIIYLFKL